MKFSEMYKYKALPKYEGLIGSLPCRSPTTYVGLELELEEVIEKPMCRVPSSFTVENDGSLKRNGVEYITKPLRCLYVEEELKRLFSYIHTPLLSSRCSVHVHLNARDFTPEELGKFLLLYQIYEKSLFKYSGNRWDNIFCVPMYSHNDVLINNLHRLFSRQAGGLSGYKYSALNICPLFGGESKHALGTVEFRHMSPTLDVPHIVDWINLITSLKLSAKKIKLSTLVELIQNMNTDSSYIQLTHSVFENWAGLILTQPTFQKDVESCILRARHALVQIGTIENPNEQTIINIDVNKKRRK